MAHIRYSRAGRKEQIEFHMLESKHKAHTVNSIARMVDMKPSTHLRNLLAEMYTDNVLATKVILHDDGSVARRLYGHVSRIEQDTDFHIFYFPF